MAEDKARETIDEKLENSGWVIQNKDGIDFNEGLGVAVREFQLTTGAADYFLFIDRNPVGVIEAKPEGHTLGGVDYQSDKYASGLPDWMKNPSNPEPIRFLYESTGIETLFRDRRDPESRSRKVFSFHTPQTLNKWVKEDDTLRSRLHNLPPLEKGNLRDCQYEAITNLEKSFSENRPRALIQMATGTGKTYMAVSSSYRLIKHAKANRILFLVDRNNLGRQAYREFRNFKTPDDGRRFEELYNIQHLQSNQLDKVSKVTICTIQRLYSMLTNRETKPENEEGSMYEESDKNIPEAEVEYNADIPIDYFDFIITDECHRSIYNKWRQVLEYFDAFIVGLTATPSAETIGFFEQNLVMEYSHQRAVADGVNVGYDTYYIETAISKDGSTIPTGFRVITLDKVSRRTLWQTLDEDYSYDAQKLDRSVVSKSQIRTVIRTFKENLFTEIFPRRTLVPKTIIFTKNDSHAEDVLHIVRTEFGLGNDFAKKITYMTTGDTPENLIKAFRNSPLPRIVVSVDMIATGTDIRPVECLLFMRDVRSRIYFEQMKGRGSRTLDETELHAVSPDVYRKTHYIVVDAVGVTDSIKTDSRPLERNKSVSFDDLIERVKFPNPDEDTLSSLAGRLSRLDKTLSKSEKEEIKELAGVPLNVLINDFLSAIDIDTIFDKAVLDNNVAEPSEEMFEKARQELTRIACMPFDDPGVRNMLKEIHQRKYQIIDEYSIDRVIDTGFLNVAGAQKIVQNFQEFIEKNKDQILALQVFYSQPYGKRHLTHQMVKELADALQTPPFYLDPDRLWKAYEQLNRFKVRGAGTRRLLTDLISILRYELQETDTLMPFKEVVEQNYQEWMSRQEKQGTKFTEEQISWLTMIKNHLTGSLIIEQQDLQYAPFQQQGGIIRARQLFGEQLPVILDEITQVTLS